MIKPAKSLLLPAAACLLSLSPAPRPLPPCQRIDITDALHANRYHASLIFDSQGRVVSCNEGFQSVPMMVNYDARGHIINVPGMVQAKYDNSTGEIGKLTIGSSDEVMDFTFLHDRVELAKLVITGQGLSRTTNFVYTYGNTDKKDADPVSVKWHYDEYKGPKHTESADAQYLLTYSHDPFFVGADNVISRMMYAYPPHAPVVSVHYRLVSGEQLTIVTHDLVKGKDATLNRNSQFSYTLDTQGRPIKMTTTGTLNGRQLPPAAYNIIYSCN